MSKLFCSPTVASVLSVVLLSLGSGGIICISLNRQVYVDTMEIWEHFSVTFVPVLYLYISRMHRKFGIIDILHPNN